ncbi:hypothetical protein BTUL_0009g00490 [Botrytis tulipae]|uniref:Uncharacterized protein n=1 Tax=Botrytis tulipae TaxID=87230 RepID=A0A4Z1F4A1_9HELO|nr:hypothetical protein BTUL_0009g00490 [Botrytis tulipae]
MPNAELYVRNYRGKMSAAHLMGMKILENTDRHYHTQSQNQKQNRDILCARDDGNYLGNRDSGSHHMLKWNYWAARSLQTAKQHHTTISEYKISRALKMGDGKWYKKVQ